MNEKFVSRETIIDLYFIICLDLGDDAFNVGGKYAELFDESDYDGKLNMIINMAEAIKFKAREIQKSHDV